MFTNIEQILTHFAGSVPLAVFAFIASLTEEVIPPIPSPAIMIITGFLASVQHYSIYGLIILCLAGTVGKTIGAWIMYFIMDKVEDFLTTRFGKLIGVTHEQVEAFGARLGKGPRDYLILTFLRALPIFPSVVLSVGGGLLKIPLRLFLFSTFVGSLFRNVIYIYLGYIGISLTETFFKKSASAESVIEVVAAIAVVLFFGYFYYRRRKAKL